MGQTRVGVIGGGVGGLAAALELQRRGIAVTLFERHAQIGGKASEYRDTNGFRWDEGPSIVVMPWVYRELFESAGLEVDDYLPLQRLDPAFRVVFSDGSRAEIPADEDALFEVFSEIDSADGAALKPFLKRLDRFAAAIGHAYCDRPVESWPGILTSRLMTSAAIISPFQKYSEEIDKTFRSRAVRELLYGFPTYSGFSPTEAPASLQIIPWTILREGVWYPAQGGIAAIPHAIAAACQHRGVEILTGVEVEAIELSVDGRVQSLATSRGSFEFDAVVSNSDYVHTHQLLRGPIPPSNDLEAIRSGQVEPSASYFTIQLGSSRTWDLNAHHLLILTEGSNRVYHELFEKGIYPTDPPIYVNVTSVTDPSDAPEGGCNPFIVVAAPPLGADSARDPDFEIQYADQLIERLERAGMTGLKDSLVTRRTTTPTDFQSRFHAFRGAIYGLGSQHNILGGGFRPRVDRPEIPGLFFSGGGVQPGAGLPMAVQSGKISAHKVTEFVRRQANRRSTRRVSSL